MSMRLYTKVLSAGQSFTLTEEYKALMFSFQVSTGTGDNATFIGNFTNPVTEADSEEIPLSAGQGQVYVSSDPQKSLSGITITSVAGSVNIVIGY